MLTFICKKISGVKDVAWEPTEHTVHWWDGEYCRNTWLYTSQISSRRNNRNAIWTLCVQYGVCEWWGHPLHTFIPAQRGHTWNQLAGVWCCSEVADGGARRGGGTGGWLFSQPHWGRRSLSCSRVSLATGNVKAKIPASKHTRHGLTGHREVRNTRREGSWERDKAAKEMEIDWPQMKGTVGQVKASAGVNSTWWAKCDVCCNWGFIYILQYICLYWKHMQTT